jgi:hypothetical protein
MRQPESPQSLKIEAFSHSLALSWSPPQDIGVPILGYVVGYGRYIPEVYRAILPPTDRTYVIGDLSKWLVLCSDKIASSEKISVGWL